MLNRSGSDRELLKTLFHTSLSQIMGDEVRSLFFSLPITIAMKSHLLNDIVRATGENVGWLHFLSRDAHKCSKRCLDSNEESI